MRHSKQLINGDIVFHPKYGIPNETIPGYTQDLDNPYLYRLNYLPCKRREDNKRIRLSCGRIVSRTWCNKLNMMICALTCKNCSVREPPTD